MLIYFIKTDKIFIFFFYFFRYKIFTIYSRLNKFDYLKMLSYILITL